MIAPCRWVWLVNSAPIVAFVIAAHHDLAARANHSFCSRSMSDVLPPAAARCLSSPSRLTATG